MIGSLAQGLVGVIVDEVAAQGGRRLQQQRDGVALYQQPQQQQYQQQRQQYNQQQLPPGPLASLVESITLLFNRAVAAVVAVRHFGVGTACVRTRFLRKTPAHVWLQSKALAYRRLRKTSLPGDQVLCFRRRYHRVWYSVDECASLCSPDSLVLDRCCIRWLI